MVFKVARDENGDWVIWLPDKGGHQWVIAGFVTEYEVSGVPRDEALAAFEEFLKDGQEALQALRWERSYGI